MEYLGRAAVPSQKLMVVLSVILLLLIGATNATEVYSGYRYIQARYRCTWKCDNKVCLYCHPLQSIHIRGKRIPGHRPDTTPQPGIIYVVSYFKAVTTVPPPLLQLKPGILVTPILRMA